ncbi:unnamed protein product, partial [Timema podura]|nr:unnamed protein product [Timema podura]
VCDVLFQERVQAKDPPAHYLNKLRTYLDPKASRSSRSGTLVLLYHTETPVAWNTGTTVSHCDSCSLEHLHYSSLEHWHYCITARLLYMHYCITLLPLYVQSGCCYLQPNVCSIIYLG